MVFVPPHMNSRGDGTAETCGLIASIKAALATQAAFYTQPVDYH